MRREASSVCLGEAAANAGVDMACIWSQLNRLPRARRSMPRRTSTFRTVVFPIPSWRATSRLPMPEFVETYDLVLISPTQAFTTTTSLCSHRNRLRALILTLYQQPIGRGAERASGVGLGSRQDYQIELVRTADLQRVRTSLREGSSPNFPLVSVPNPATGKAAPVSIQ